MIVIFIIAVEFSKNLILRIVSCTIIKGESSIGNSINPVSTFVTQK